MILVLHGNSLRLPFLSSEQLGLGDLLRYPELYGDAQISGHDHAATGLIFQIEQPALDNCNTCNRPGHTWIGPNISV